MTKVPEGLAQLSGGSDALRSPSRAEYTSNGSGVVDASGPSRKTVGQRLREHLEEQSHRAEAELLSCMKHVRTSVVGGDPSWKCESASRELCKCIQQASGLEARLGHGKATVGKGAFLGSTTAPSFLPRTSAWGLVPIPPEGVPHAFVLFEDGSIADVTADQFDASLPPIWWPADPTRYDVGKKASLEDAVRAHIEQQQRQRRSGEQISREWWQ